MKSVKSFVIKNNSGGDWEDVYVGIEDADDIIEDLRQALED